jgi:ABC-type transport system substrate-binding protein
MRVESNYWTRVLQNRVSRRRALAASGATALGAAFLAACGGGDDGPTEAPLDESGLVTLPRDEGDSATAGGIMPWNHGELEFSIDPALAPSFTSSSMIAPVYSLYLKFGKKIGEKPTPGDITGDAMTEWEVSPDGLSVTYTLRPNHLFDPRPPTGGRAMTVEDVKWSYDRTEAISPLGGAVFRSAGPSGPVSGLEVVDSEHVVLKLAEPYGAINELMAYLYMYIAPIEGEDQIDLRSEARGTGPFRLERWEEGIVAEFRKNPDWYVKDRPYLDGIDKRFIAEQATVDSQFVAKQLWRSDADMLPSEILRVKDENPALLMRQSLPRLGPGGYPMNVGSFFANDPRLRRAASMVIDRDALITAVYNTNVWTDRGLDVPLIWDGHLSSNAATYLDPKGDELGEGGKWFQYNPEEAKKQLDAAGYNGQELIFVRRAMFGPANLADVISEMIRAGGFNIKDQAIEANDWRQMKLDGPSKAGYDGFFWHTANSFNDDGYLATKYTPSGRDRATDEAIPGITEKVLALRTEFDAERQVELLHDVQRDLADYMPDIPIVSTQPTLDFFLDWPWLRNTAWTVPGFDQTSSSARDYTEYFIDPDLLEQHG